MTPSDNSETISPVKSISSEDIQLCDDNVPRIPDTVLADRLGYSHAGGFRTLIRRRIQKLNEFGNLLTSIVKSGGRGRPSKVYHLNQRQAIWLCMQAETDKAFDLQAEIVEVFAAYQRGELAPTTALAPSTSDQQLAVARQMEALQTEVRQELAIHEHNGLELVRVLRREREERDEEMEVMRAQMLVWQHEMRDWKSRDENCPYDECRQRINTIVRKYGAVVGKGQFGATWRDVYDELKADHNVDLRRLRERHNSKGNVKLGILDIAEQKGHARRLLVVARAMLQPAIDRHEEEQRMQAQRYLAESVEFSDDDLLDDDRIWN